VIVSLADAEATREFGVRLAGLLRPGDLVILVGALGAGKTTLAQGIGQGLGVVGTVASPTFIIARSHAAGARGIPLIHVDAYRLTSLAELDDLDLDSALADSVTLVEWGEGKAEALDPSHLRVEIDRGRGGSEADPASGTRQATVTGHGPRWAGVDLASVAPVRP
jgi:tRNA threonylcarbamoyladenosine biosynthesis protein TsaE